MYGIAEDVKVVAEVVAVEEVVEAVLGIVLVISNIHTKSGVDLPMETRSAVISRSLMFTVADFVPLKKCGWNTTNSTTYHGASHEEGYPVLGNLASFSPTHHLVQAARG